jgi:hypothetical protein
MAWSIGTGPKKHYTSHLDGSKIYKTTKTYIIASDDGRRNVQEGSFCWCAVQHHHHQSSPGDRFCCLSAQLLVRFELLRFEKLLDFEDGGFLATIMKNGLLFKPHQRSNNNTKERIS